MLAAFAHAGARDPASDATLERMALSTPRGLRDRLYARLLRLALARSAER